MAQSVTFPNGNTYNDGVSGTGHLANNGHKTNFLPMIQDTIDIANEAVNASYDAGASALSASSSANAASASAAGVTLTATSTSSVTIGTGSKVFVLPNIISIQIGQWFKCTDQANSANYVYGIVSNWVPGTRTLTLTVGSNGVGGSGTISSWYCSVAGAPGAQGPAGAGTGDMLAANNLSDVANAATARSNLGAEAANANLSKINVAETRSANINMADYVLERPVIKDAAEATKNQSSYAGGAFSMNYSEGHWHYITSLTGNISGITITNPPATGTAGTVMLEIVQDGSGGRTLTLNPSIYKAKGGILPVLTSTPGARDFIYFKTRDGGATWFVSMEADVK